MKPNTYTAFHEKIAKPYKNRPVLAKILFWTDKTATVLVCLAFFVATVYSLLQKEPLGVFLRFLAPPALALLLVSLLRRFIRRPRPYERGVTPLFIEKKTGNSFPSRHAASAFSIGVALLPFFPLLAISALVLGAFFLYSRTVLGWHYPSDLVCGAILGSLCGALAFL